MPIVKDVACQQCQDRGEETTVEQVYERRERDIQGHEGEVILRAYACTPGGHEWTEQVDDRR